MYGEDDGGLDYDFNMHTEGDMFDRDDFEDLDRQDDGQPDEYTEWQDLYGGDDWDHGQYDNEY